MKLFGRVALIIPPNNEKENNSTSLIVYDVETQHMCQPINKIRPNLCACISYLSGLCLITCRKKIDQQYFNQGLVKGIILLASALRWIHNIPPNANNVSSMYKFIIIILQSFKLHSKIIPIKTSLES